jgi:hypothetical protein
MSVAVQSIMEGMPEPYDLRCSVHNGWTVVTVGCRVGRETGSLERAASGLTQGVQCGQ